MAQTPDDTHVQCLGCEKTADEEELFYCKKCNNNKIRCDKCGEFSHQVGKFGHSWDNGKISLKLEGKLPADIVISKYYASTIEESETAIWKTALKTSGEGAMLVGKRLVMEYGKNGMESSLGSIVGDAIGPVFVSLAFFWYETHLLASKCDTDSDEYKRGVQASATRNLAGCVGSCVGGAIGCAAGPLGGIALAAIAGTACQWVGEQISEYCWPKEVCLIQIYIIRYTYFFICDILCAILV